VQQCRNQWLCKECLNSLRPSRRVVVRRTLVSNFAEGLLAPFAEFFISILVLLMEETLLALQEAFQQALSLLSGQPLAVPDAPQLMEQALFWTALMDLARNLAMGFLFPAHAVAHLIGEVVSLPLLLWLFLHATGLIHSTTLEAILSTLFSITVMLLGVVARLYLEERSESVALF